MSTIYGDLKRKKNKAKLSWLSDSGLCSSTWETALGAKGIHQPIASKETSPQSYNHRVLDFANNLNVFGHAITEHSGSPAYWCPIFSLLKLGVRKPAKPNWSADLQNCETIHTHYFEFHLWCFVMSVIENKYPKLQG